MHGIRSKPLYHVHRLGLGPAGNNEKRASGHWSFSFSIQLAVSGAPHFLFHGGPVCFEWIEWRLVPPSHARSSLSHFANRTAVPWKLKSFRSTSTAIDMLRYIHATLTILTGITLRDRVSSRYTVYHITKRVM